MKRVEMAKIILHDLSSEENDWKDIVTGDESWFLWSYENDQIWLQHGSKRPQIPKPTIGMKKSLFSIYFSPRGIILVDIVLQGQRYNSTYFTQTILPELESYYRKFRPKSGLKNVILHLDNARPHNSLISSSKIEELGMKRMKHPPYSQDISPLDFWLFVFLKEKLK